MENFIYSIAGMIITLGVIIIVHEGGHFIAARLCGVKVLTFSIGFGPKIFTHYDKYGTQYALSAIPLGGYVQMLGEDQNEEDSLTNKSQLSQTLIAQPLINKAFIVAAGPMANFLLAIVLYFLVALQGETTPKPLIGNIIKESPVSAVDIPTGSEIIKLDNTPIRTWDDLNRQLIQYIGIDSTVSITVIKPDKNIQTYTLQIHNWLLNQEIKNLISSFGIIPYIPEIQNIVANIAIDSPAHRSGILTNDKIIKINDASISKFQDITKIVRNLPNTQVLVTLIRNNTQHQLQIELEEMLLDNNERIGYLGIQAAPPRWQEDKLITINRTFLESAIKGFVDTVSSAKLSLISMKKMLFGEISIKNLSGPVSIAHASGINVKSGLISTLSFIAFISVSIGVLNLLPIPVLDGGHLVFYLIEFIIGKPIKAHVQQTALKIGMSCLFALMIFTLINDINRLL